MYACVCLCVRQRPPNWPHPAVVGPRRSRSRSWSCRSVRSGLLVSAGSYPRALHPVPVPGLDDLDSDAVHSSARAPNPAAYYAVHGECLIDSGSESLNHTHTNQCGKRCGDDGRELHACWPVALSSRAQLSHRWILDDVAKSGMLVCERRRGLRGKGHRKSRASGFWTSRTERFQTLR